jgi:hypothetical protein
MVQNLTSNVLETPNEGNNICERVALGCRGSLDKDTYKSVCNIHRGNGCELKTSQFSSYNMTGELF